MVDRYCRSPFSARFLSFRGGGDSPDFSPEGGRGRRKCVPITITKLPSFRKLLFSFFFLREVAVCVPFRPGEPSFGLRGSYKNQREEEEEGIWRDKSLAIFFVFFSFFSIESLKKRHAGNRAWHLFWFFLPISFFPQPVFFPGTHE